MPVTWDERVSSADDRHVWHPYTQHQGMVVPLEVVRAEGAYLETRDGRRLFDAISSWWVTLHGHAQPEIAEAIAQQAKTLDQVIFTTFTHEPAALLAEELVQVLPNGITRVFFSDDGSTAVEVAVKMALQYHANRGTPRHMIAALENAYHGDTFGAMSVSERSMFTKPFESQLFDVRRLPDPAGTTGNGEETLAALDALLERHGSELAAVIIEPLLMGVSGMRMYGGEVV
ncbi:MAG TPA: aminotransferase class III-fold pyridoxal phosphate-dependent enzyme, partial [Gemmatimonadaceae bacterium]|nr:aminotransferase class III-fold pyridoxal phosphate-dependent enzyme [Gemmatimonadaceae bacterium]